jgi:hypothetical protein
VTGQFLQVDPAIKATHEPYAYVAGDPLASVDPLGLCKGMDGTPQDRVCTANDFFWAGLPGEMNKQFKIAWAGFSAGSTLGIGLVTNNDVDCYGANPEFWVEFALGALVTAATSVLSGAVTAEAEVVTEGIYVARTEVGAYVGQSGIITTRLAQHIASGKFTSAEVNAAERMTVLGGKTAREVAEQLKIDELGGLPNLLNKVNPVGLRRVDLMPIGYVR